MLQIDLIEIAEKNTEIKITPNTEDVDEKALHFSFNLLWRFAVMWKFISQQTIICCLFELFRERQKLAHITNLCNFVYYPFSLIYFPTTELLGMGICGVVRWLCRIYMIYLLFTLVYILCSCRWNSEFCEGDRHLLLIIKCLWTETF